VSEIFSDTFFPIDPPGLREGDPQNAEYSAECDALAPEFLERFDQIPRQRPDAIENAVGNWFRR